MELKITSETDTVLRAQYKGRNLTIEQPTSKKRFEGLTRAMKTVDAGGPAGPRATARKLNPNNGDL